MSYTVNEVARMAGLSVRTLHHYDRIGLLEPSARSRAGYRLYEEKDLFRLQQVLFYRELDMPLGSIKAELDRPGFDPALALEGHRRLLEERAARIARLLATIDRTIATLGGEESMLTTEELYEGFPKEKAERWEREAEKSWGSTDAYKESRKRVARMTKEQWAAVMKEGAETDLALAAALARGLAPGSPEARRLVGRKVAQLRHFYEPSAEMVAGLGAMYADSPEFRAHYDELAPGLAEFLRDAMAIYAREEMK
jgi:DNA-binding transcriptional MerR regulator